MVNLKDEYYCGQCRIWHRRGITRPKLYKNHMSKEIEEPRIRVIPEGE